MIFLQTIADDKIGIKETHTNKGGEISPYRDTLYTPHIQSWTTIMDYIGDIETQYLQHRTSGDIGKKNRLALIIKDLQFHLIQVADFMNVVVVALHGETPSDKIE